GQFLELPHKADLWLERLATIAAFLQFGIWISALLDFWITRSRNRVIDTQAAGAGSLDPFSFLGRLVLWTLVLLLVLDNLGVNITALATSLGVGGIAVALAVQNILGDLFASLSIVMDKPFVIGDSIAVDSLSGTVEHIGLKTTRIRSSTGEQLIVANSDMLKARLRNYKRMQERCITFGFTVPFSTPADRLERIPGLVRGIIESVDKVRFDRAHFKDLGGSAYGFEVVYWVREPDYRLYMDSQQAINLALVRAFEKEGVQLAYPAQTLTVDPPGPAGAERVDPALRDHPGHRLRAELLAGMGQRHHARRPGRCRRRGGAPARPRGAPRRHPGEAAGDARPPRPCQRRARPGRAAEAADRGPPPGRPVLDRGAARPRAALRFSAGAQLRAGPLAAARRQCQPGLAAVRRAALPRPYAGPCRVPPCALAAGFRRRRAVPGLDRPHRFPARQPRRPDPLDPPAPVPARRRDPLRARSRADVDLRGGAADQSLRLRPGSGFLARRRHRRAGGWRGRRRGSGRGGELAVAVVGQGLLDLLARIHHEGAVLHHRLAQRPRRQQQEARAFGAGLHPQAVAVGQHAGGAVRQFALLPVRADRGTALVGVEEGIAAGRQRRFEAAVRRQLHVDVQRIGGEPRARAV